MSDEEVHYSITNTGRTVSIDTPGARFDIEVVASGEIEIYTPDGRLVNHNKSGNVMRVQCVPLWDDATLIKVAAHELEKGGDYLEMASRVVSIIRGRTNINKTKRNQE